ncbi:superfamily II DNA/RNA helicase, SNF2 family [Cenarchaeum symbiosum A]|uniref:Superfamily II DNA/RNA helicase, SNF2 family n=1 Tax=Cenarchaeum symbiosum (strain A) TaxID=414004 RepID=A0RXR8_CENSY|nr:superfamily II DNA/RNA helicase, SNF2 family [Cenarchaeum symbiosum A]
MTLPPNIDIIDNVDTHMDYMLNAYIPEVSKIDISTGYFNVEGYAQIRKTLEPYIKSGHPLRLLLGTDALRPGQRSFETYKKKLTNNGKLDDDASNDVSMSADLDGKLDVTKMDNVASLMNLVRNNNVEVRMGDGRFNHSKCYIVSTDKGGAAFVGSSNLTYGGLHKNMELNAGLYGKNGVESTEKWFEKAWDGSNNWKDELVKMLRESKYGEPGEPFDVYLKVLYEMHRPRLEAENINFQNNVKLAKFQRKAVGTCLAIIDQMGGAILADSTGLGKTNTGLEVTIQKMLKGGRALLVAPRQILDTMWDIELAKLRFRIDTVGTEELGRADFDRFDEFADTDFIIVDESQRFRSKETGRRDNLMKIISTGKKKQVLLLSATPVNNTIMDLYYQISLITGGDDTKFADSVYIHNLHKHFTSSAKVDGLKVGLGKIEDLLHTIMVRRTRSHIMTVDGGDEIDGRPIKFPEQKYKKIEYAMPHDFFKDLAEKTQGLTMAPYSVEYYNNLLSPKEQEAQRNLGGLQKYSLFKRFESSIVAATKSLERRISMYEHFLALVKKDRIVPATEINDVLRAAKQVKPATEKNQLEYIKRELDNLSIPLDKNKYKQEQMETDLEADIKTLYEMQSMINRLEKDNKLDAIIKALKSDGIGKRKALIFTEFTDTAEYIGGKLDKLGRVEVISGKNDDKTRKDVIQRFAPDANPPSASNRNHVEENPVDILVSTEILSEGQNMQDCNYVLNYDLPWNPMRIVQRDGRVNRLNSTYEYVDARACFPSKGLDDILKFTSKIAGKIDTANKVVGLDMELLGEMPNEKQYGVVQGRIKALSSSDEKGKEAMEAIQRDSDAMPTMSPFNELRQLMNNISIEYMDKLTMGRRSGKKGEERTILAYLAERTIKKNNEEKIDRNVHLVEFLPGKKARVATNRSEMLSYMKCEPNEPSMPLGDVRKSFHKLVELDKEAVEAIHGLNVGAARTNRALHEKSAKSGKTMSDLRRIIDRSNNEPVSADKQDEAYALLQSDRMLAREKALSKVLSEYTKDGDYKKMIDGILDAGVSVVVEEENVPKGKAKLKLIGAMFISGEKKPANGKVKRPEKPLA